MNRYLFFLLLVFISSKSYVFCQESEILAKMNNLIISEEEFKFRYELTPQLFRENKNIKSELKLEFLYSLIAEKLLALYGDEIKLDTSLVVKESLQYFEEMFVRDALYKIAVKEKSKAKADSLLAYYLNNANNVKMISIYSNNPVKINNIYRLISIGIPFDSIYTELKTDEKDTITISVGILDEETENKIFRLPDGAILEPIKIKDVWYIFKILKRNNPLITKSNGWESDFKNLVKIATERADNEYYQKYLKEFFEKKEMKLNAKLLRSLSKSILDVLSQNPNNSSAPYSLSTSDIVLTTCKLGIDTLRLPIAEIMDDKYTVKDFLTFLKFDTFSTDTLEQKSIFNKLSYKLRNFIEYKMLANEGYRMKLQNLPEVKKQYQLWKENYYMQLVTSSFIDSAKIDDDEISKYLTITRGKTLKKKEVEIVKIISDSLETIEKIFSKIQQGEDFFKLADYYSSLPGNNTQKILTGYISASGSDPVALIAGNMKLGDLYGPLKVDERYLIFKLTGVKEDSTYISTDNEDLDEIKLELGFLKKKNSYNSFIASLATKYGLKVFIDKLNDINVTSHQSLVYHYLGFGSRIIATPLLNINMEWVPEWKNKISNLQ